MEGEIVSEQNPSAVVEEIFGQLVQEQLRFKKIPVHIAPRAIMIERGPRNSSKRKVYLVEEKPDGTMVIYKNGRESEATLEYKEGSIPLPDGNTRREAGFVIKDARELGLKPRRDDGTLYASTGTTLPEYFSGWYQSANILKRGEYVNVSVFALSPGMSTEPALEEMARSISTELNLGAKAG